MGQRTTSNSFAESVPTQGDLFECYASASDDAIIRFSMDGAVIDVNVAVERLLGYSRSECLCMSADTLGFASQADGSLSFSQRIGIGRRRGSAKTREGSKVDLQICVTEIRCADVNEIIVTLIDLAGVDLPESGRDVEAFLASAALDSAADGVFTVATSGAICTMNRAAEALFGYSSELLVGRSFAEVVPSQHPGIRSTEFSGFMRQETDPSKLLHIATLGRRHDGTRFETQLSISAFRTHSEVRYAVVARDVSQLKESQRKLEASERRSAAIVETAADAVITIGERGLINSFNRAAEQMLGYSTAEVVGKNVNVLMPAVIRSEHDSYIRTYLKTGTENVIGRGREVEARRKDGTIFPAHLAVSHYNVDGHHYFAGVLRDITDVVTQREKIGSFNQDLEKQNAVKAKQLELGEIGRSDLLFEELCEQFLAAVVTGAGGMSGVFYAKVKGEGRLEDVLCPMAGYAFPRGRLHDIDVRIGEGHVGQACANRKLSVLNEHLEFFSLDSAFGSMRPRSLVAVPIGNGEEILGAMEIAFLTDVSSDSLSYLESCAGTLAVLIAAYNDKSRIEELFAESQAQSEILSAINSELGQQSKLLLAQQSELGQANGELRAKQDTLHNQTRELAQANVKLKASREAIEGQLKDLEIAGAYKSEFLAKVSHELRTPLNSILLLSRLLGDNDRGNLDEEQSQSARLIEKSGTDLLTLINDILDLSKVGAGELRFATENVSLLEIFNEVSVFFASLLDEKCLRWVSHLGENLPDEIVTDPVRVQQILRNLIGNAIKFTEDGAVELHISRPRQGTEFIRETLNEGNCVCFRVKDDGIGIAEQDQKRIFEAFKQVDGAELNRKYQGTGLGLSIASQFAHKLGGEIHLQSELHKGAEFFLYLPVAFSVSNETRQAPTLDSPIPTAPRARLVESGALQQQALGIGRPDPSRHLLKGHSVLVVDTDMRTVFAFRQLILNEGGEVFVAEDTSEARKELSRNSEINCLVLDISTGVTQGLALAAEFRLNARRDLRIVLCCIEGGNVTEEMLRKFQADGYVEKNANPETIVAAIAGGVENG